MREHRYIRPKENKTRPLNALINNLKRLNDPSDLIASWSTAILLLLIETIGCMYIIKRVPYTEIDWIAYMQEVDGFLQGERNYVNLKGDTGPLVYPAGFVYLFSTLKLITGGSPHAAQVWFLMVYILTQFVVMKLYIDSRMMPPWSLGLLCISRRLHSIYLLRLFNDCWAMLFAYIATSALQKQRWTLSVLLFSLAVSVKMNVLLFAPGVLAVFIKRSCPVDLAKAVAGGVLLQVVVAAPFLKSHPLQYLSKAFELSRVFQYQWTVNWQILTEPIFISRAFAACLLLIHLSLLLVFANKHWLHNPTRAISRFFSQATATASKTEKQTKQRRRSMHDTLYIVFSSNLIGVLTARSLHYQFYAWYYHSLPYLLFSTNIPRTVSVGVLVLVELVWNIYPPSSICSALLLATHCSILYKLYYSSQEKLLKRIKSY